MDKTIKSKMYKGMETATVELDNKELENVEGGAISISLESLRADLHNQTYGLIVGSTGCISNPSGPSC
jgi:bacteriocin-like protein